MPHWISGLGCLRNPRAVPGWVTSTFSFKRVPADLRHARAKIVANLSLWMLVRCKRGGRTAQTPCCARSLLWCGDTLDSGDVKALHRGLLFAGMCKAE